MNLGNFDRTDRTGSVRVGRPLLKAARAPALDEVDRGRNLSLHYLRMGCDDDGDDED
jgi:hypothetical protein